MQPWVAKVGIAQQHSLALLGKEDGKVPAEKAFSLSRQGTGHQHRTRGRSTARQQQRGSQRAKRLDKQGVRAGLARATAILSIQADFPSQGRQFLLIGQHAERRRAQLT